MFKRRTKVPPVPPVADFNTPSVSEKSGSTAAAIDNNNGDVIRSTTATSAIGVTSRCEKPEVQQPSIFDDNDDDPDADESLNGLQRMKRNLTVSRSGRYKSKSRPRPTVSAMQASAAVPSVAPSSQSTVSGQSYVPSVMATGGSITTSGYGALSGISPPGSTAVGTAVSSPYRGQQAAPRGLSTAL